MRRIDAAALRRGVFLRDQLLDGHFREARIGVVALQVVEDDFLRLDEQVPVFARGRPELREVEAQLGHAGLEDVQFLEHRETLSIGRQFVDVETVVIRRQRRHPLGVEVREVCRGHRAAERCRLCDDRARDVALVEGIAPLVLQQLERACQRGVAEYDTGRRHLAVRVVGVERVAILLHLGVICVRVGHLRGDALRPRESVGREIDGGLQHLFEIHRARVLEQLIPSIDRARHVGREDAKPRHARARIETLCFQQFGRDARSRPAARVDADQLVLLRHIDDREHVAADAGTFGLDDIEHRGGRNRRIDRVAALLQDAQSRLRRERMARRHHAIARHHFCARLREPAFGTVTAHGVAGGRKGLLVRRVAGRQCQWRRRRDYTRRDQCRCKKEHKTGAVEADHAAPPDGKVGGPAWIRTKDQGIMSPLH